MIKQKGMVLEILIVLLTILMSKTVYFGIINRSFTMVFLTALLTLIILKKRTQISKKALKTVLSMVYVLLLGIVAHFSDLTIDYLIVEIGFIVLILEMAIVVNYIKKDLYSKIYVNIMTIISIVSLVYFSISINFPHLVNILAERVQVGNTTFIISPFYTWGYDSFIYPRNAGPFWEPGAFQGFILVALIMLLFYKDNIKMYRGKLIILTATILTTQSTTGYILLGLVFMIFWSDILKLFSGKRNALNSLKTMLVFPILSLILIYGVFFIINSETINNKFDDDNISFNARSNDIYNSLVLISEKPLFGYGSGKEKLIRESSAGIENNSVGLLTLIYTYGLIFFAVYSYKFKRGLDSIFPFKNKIKRLGIYVIFSILFMAQGLYYLPVFILFLFEWPDVTNENIGNNHS